MKTKIMKIESATSIRPTHYNEEPISAEDRVCQRVLNLVNETEMEGIYIATIEVKRNLCKDLTFEIALRTQVHVCLDEEINDKIKVLNEKPASES